jgi:hypothetical protein
MARLTHRNRFQKDAEAKFQHPVPSPMGPGA